MCNETISIIDFLFFLFSSSHSMSVLELLCNSLFSWAVSVNFVGVLHFWIDALDGLGFVALFFFFI